MTAAWIRPGSIKAIGVESVQITLICLSGEIMVIIFKEVLYVFGFLTNQVFVPRLYEKKIYWRSDNFTLQMTKTDAKMKVCKIVRSLFVLQTEKT